MHQLIPLAVDLLNSPLKQLVEMRTRQPHDNDYATERHVATYLSNECAGEGFHRIGPKQARNILQIIGLSWYEPHLDSRITKWLNSNLDLPYNVSGQGLSNPEHYPFIMDIFQDSCATADVLPCIFDAAVFSGYDTDWTQSDAEAIF